MTSGRYTAYHIYQNLSFPEAQKAGTWPYKLPEYQCRHSQRGYLFQFENMVERTHFDAAVTSCCNEPVLNFANKPQYAEAAKPMNPQDCGAKVESVGCTVLEVYVESASAFCASANPKVRRIKIQCPSQCPDLVSIMSGGKLKGRYGAFTSLGMEAGDQMILQYTPDAEMVSGWYLNCSGVGAITEEFCGGYTISYMLRAGLNFPYGCRCDCCGEEGPFPPPVMTLDVPSQISGTWDNSLDINRDISGDESCSGGNITGTFSGSGGSASAVVWSGSTEYHSDNITRFVTRFADSVGTSGNPACCGGQIIWSGSDGCQSGDDSLTTVVPRIGSSQILPASGNTFYEGETARFSGSGACAYATSANLAIQESCLTNATDSLLRFPGYLTRGLAWGLQFSGTHQCSGCCGAGSITVSFANGCGQTTSGQYSVRRHYSDNNMMGRIFWCGISGSNWKVKWGDLQCGGTSGSFGESVVSYSGLSACIAAISGANGEYISGAGGCSGNISGGTDCCWYTDNGLSGSDFRSRIYVLSGSRCCHIEGQSGSWVFGSSSGGCCPV